MPFTSKYRLAEQSQRLILGGNPTDDREVTTTELMLYVEQCLGQLVKLNYFQNKQEGESTVNGDFIYSFEDVGVKQDEAKSLFYSELPATSMALPHDMGVYGISCMKDQRNAFVRVPNGFMSLYNGLASSNLEGRQGYFLENKRVYYPNMDVADNIKGVLMKLVVPLGGIEPDEEINIPLDFQHDIVNKTTELFLLEQDRPKDIENDNFK